VYSPVVMSRIIITVRPLPLPEQDAWQRSKLKDFWGTEMTEVTIF